MTSSKVRSGKGVARASAIAKGRSGVTIVRQEDGSFGWRPSDGRAVMNAGKRIFGRIHGIEDEATARSPAYELSRKVIQDVLRQTAMETKARSGESTGFKLTRRGGARVHGASPAVTEEG